MNLEKVFETPNNENHFFGYYDVPQLCSENLNLISVKVENIYEIPSAKNEYEIFYTNIKTGEKKLIGKTKTLNFQQGCRAQWLGPKHDTEIIYNDYDNGSYVSKIYDIKKNKVRTIPVPIYSVSKDGKYIITPSFERLFWCRRGYSYDAIKDPLKNMQLVLDESIKLYEIQSKKEEKILNIKDVIAIENNSNMNGATHYIEHLMFSPCSKKFIFLHRYKIKDGGIFSRLFLYNIENKNLKLILNSGRISHFNFINENLLIFYGSIGSLVTNFRKYKYFQKIFKSLLKIYKLFIKDNSLLAKKITKDGYYYYNFLNSKFTKVHNNKLNSEDGHPTCNYKLNDDFITDNYSDIDNNHKPSLHWYSKQENNTKEIYKFDSIAELDNSPLRADLHPRISYDGNYISVDTFKNGFRKSICFKINY
jgi:hypothetical protein